MAAGEIILLNKTQKLKASKIQLPASKSESNRALIIAALAGGNSRLENLSEARDTRIMNQLLGSSADEWNAKDAGTTFRFLTAYAALTQKDKILTGTPRMQQRPIRILVEALKELGAKISYLGDSGYPPLRIQKMVSQKKKTLEIQGNVSSQYISALMMIAPCLDHGLEIRFRGKVTSLPYLQMTSSIMQVFGVETNWNEDGINISPQKYREARFAVESDWSASSYWYSFAALAEDSKIELQGLRQRSFQGDQAVAGIMDQLGVQTQYTADSVILTKKDTLKKELDLDFADCPDLAQTIAVICAAKGVRCTMTGLESLKIKETDRILALQKELSKVGALLIEKNNTWTLIPPSDPADWDQPLKFKTYEDHRMAMAFAPLCTQSNIRIEDPQVVNKSYPGFWKDLQQAGVVVS